MLLGWSLLVIAMAITASLSYSFVRIVAEEAARRPQRRREPLARRAGRLVRILTEPVLGR